MAAADTAPMHAETDTSSELLGHVAHIAAAYLSRNQVAPDAIARVLNEIKGALTSIGQPAAAEQEKQTPAVSIRKSVTPDYIVCLEDGKKLKMLKRHLRTMYGMTPEEYRAKWGLPADYPMVAPTYAARRSEFAKSIGLGKSRSAPEPVVPSKPARGRK